MLSDIFSLSKVGFHKCMAVPWAVVFCMELDDCMPVSAQLMF
jgi:hypothetical protein